MLKAGQIYPSDLTEQQWNAIKDLLPCAKKGGRPRTTNIRSVISAIFYLIRSGCAWRYLPRSYPPWRTVYEYFQKWQRIGVWKKLHDFICNEVRRKAHKALHPTTLIIDSQSIRCSRGTKRGYDGHKKLRGRKRQILVDTLGIIHSVNIHAANLNDCTAGFSIFNKLPENKASSLRVLYADQGYRGRFVRQFEARFNFSPTILGVRKNNGQGRKKTTAQKMANRKLRRIKRKKRWIVERTFGWFNHYRRLSKDYETKTYTSELMIRLAMIQLLLKRMHPT